MRVVLDTNVFISAFLGGRLRVIVDAWKTGKFTLVISEAIAREYLNVLNRPKFKITAREIAPTTDYLLKRAEFVTPTKSFPRSRMIQRITNSSKRPWLEWKAFIHNA